MATKNKSTKTAKTWGLVRISLGLTFLWAFFDKLIGLGFATCRDAQTDEVVVNCARSWLNGGSPTSGFLNFGTSGPFAEFYQGLAGNALVDWLFMLGLLGIGLGLTLGIAMKLSTISGAVLLLMMYTAAMPPANNPLLDDHIIYALVLVGLLKTGTGTSLGLGSWWSSLPVVKKWPVLG